MCLHRSASQSVHADTFSFICLTSGRPSSSSLGEDHTPATEGSSEGASSRVCRCCAAALLDSEEVDSAVGFNWHKRNFLPHFCLVFDVQSGLLEAPQLKWHAASTSCFFFPLFIIVEREHSSFLSSCVVKVISFNNEPCGRRPARILNRRCRRLTALLYVSVFLSVLYFAARFISHHFYPPRPPSPATPTLSSTQTLNNEPSCWQPSVRRRHNETVWLVASERLKWLLSGFFSPSLSESIIHFGLRSVTNGCIVSPLAKSHRCKIFWFGFRLFFKIQYLHLLSRRYSISCSFNLSSSSLNTCSVFGEAKVTSRWH